MHEKRLEQMLDAWGEAESMSAPPLPVAVRARLGRVRAQRTATIGVVTLIALLMIVALGFALDETPERDEPDPPAEIIEETGARGASVDSTIGGIYTLNDGFRALSGEVRLPETGALGSDGRAVMTVGSPAPD